MLIATIDALTMNKAFAKVAGNPKCTYFLSHITSLPHFKYSKTSYWSLLFVELISFAQEGMI